MLGRSSHVFGWSVFPPNWSARSFADEDELSGCSYVTGILKFIDTNTGQSLYETWFSALVSTRVQRLSPSSGSSAYLIQLMITLPERKFQLVDNLRPEFPEHIKSHVGGDT